MSASKSTFVIDSSLIDESFKRECEKIVGKSQVKDYGAGEYEILVSESFIPKVEILLNEYGIDLYDVYVDD